MPIAEAIPSHYRILVSGCSRWWNRRTVKSAIAGLPISFSNDLKEDWTGSN
jgi:hypothetical protein